MLEIFQGLVRVILLEPIVGDFRARQIAVFSGITIIMTICFIFFDWLRAKNNFQLIAVGFLWLILTISFEILFGRFAAGLSWERILSDYNILNGGLLPFGLIILTFAPFITRKVWRLILIKDGFNRSSKSVIN